MPVTLAREFLLGSEQFKARLRCFSRGDDQLRSSIVWLGPSGLRTCPPDTASILATTFFQPSLKFRNAVAFFGNIRQYEAGMHDTQPCAAIDFGESPGDNRVEARAILRIAIVPASPRVGQALVAYHFEHLTMNHAVPRAGRRRLEREARAFHGFKSRRLH